MQETQDKLFKEANEIFKGAHYFFYLKQINDAISYLSNAIQIVNKCLVGKLFQKEELLNIIKQ